MKLILSFAIVSFLTILSCSKHDTLEKGRDLGDRKTESSILLLKPEPNKLPKAYASLVTKLKAGTISFEEFYSQLQVLLKPYKRKGAIKNSSTISGRQFGQWSFIPSYCDSENDPIGCQEFWRTECMTFCMEKYFLLTDALMLEEEAAYVDYWTAMGLCNNISNNSQRDSCKAAAATAYDDRLNPVISGYNYAANELSTCESDCGY